MSQLRQEIELPFRQANPALLHQDTTHMRQCTMIRLLFGAGRNSAALHLHHQRPSFVCVGPLWAVGLKRLVRAMFFLVCHPQTRRLPLPLPTRYDNETDRRDGSLFCFFPPCSRSASTLSETADLEFWMHMHLNSTVCMCLSH